MLKRMIFAIVFAAATTMLTGCGAMMAATTGGIGTNGSGGNNSNVGLQLGKLVASVAQSDGIQYTVVYPTEDAVYSDRQWQYIAYKLAKLGSTASEPMIIQVLGRNAADKNQLAALVKPALANLPASKKTVVRFVIEPAASKQPALRLVPERIVEKERSEKTIDQRTTTGGGA